MLTRFTSITSRALLAGALAFFPLSVSGSEFSPVLNQVQDLVKQKDFPAAKALLAKNLKTSKNSWQLWMALGLVFEANKDYEQALTAYTRASELKTGIDGIAAKLARLQELAKNKQPEPEKPVTPEIRAQILIQQAHKLDEEGKSLEASRLFVEAVELDRSLLARDTDLIEKGLFACKSNPDHPENLMYLGAFYFYAGQYTAAEAVLNNFVEQYHQSDKIALAQKLLSECREIISQAVAASNLPAQAEIDKAKKDQNADTANKEKSDKIEQGNADQQTAEEFPTFTTGNEYDQSFSNEHPTLVLARKKAMELLNNYAQETDEDKKLGIIWSMGMLRLPVPELMSQFATFLESDSIDTIFATIEALEKIDQPGAQVCLQQLYKLLGHNDFRVVYRTIKAFARMPMSAEKIVPRIFKIYQKENMRVRRQMIEHTVKAYGQDSILILDAMLKEAEMTNKRPIAELLSALTGEDIETLINNS